jgi:hypothetical protein
LLRTTYASHLPEIIVNNATSSNSELAAHSSFELHRSTGDTGSFRNGGRLAQGTICPSASTLSQISKYRRALPRAIQIRSSLRSCRARSARDPWCRRISPAPKMRPRSRWRNQVGNTDDPLVRAMFIRQVGNCPAGRLVAWDKAAGQALEPHLPISIGLVEDPPEGCSGPLWLRGGVAVISADGFEYEVRNRATLCRCGESKNKPFCDGTHASEISSNVIGAIMVGRHE